MPLNFFSIIGAQRAGTTMLYNILDEHPHIRMAKPAYPEPKFFIRSTSKNADKSWYISQYFPHLLKYETTIGEKSTSYIENPSALRKMKRMFPGAGIIIMLREPVSRAISNYYFSKQNQIETRSIEDVFLNRKAPPPLNQHVSTSPFDYLKRGDYLPYLRQCFELCKASKIYIGFYEELISNSSAEMRRIANFLKISDDFSIKSIQRMVNQATVKEPANEEIKQALKPHFQKTNQELAAFLKRDLPQQWQY